MSGSLEHSGADLSQPVLPPESPNARAVFEFNVLTDPDVLVEHRGTSIRGIPINKALELHSYLFEKMRLSIFNKAFCITSTGSLAILPPLTRVGNTVAHIRGGMMPAVLRDQKLARWIVE
jgi:hypothetical protein